MTSWGRVQPVDLVEQNVLFCVERSGLGIEDENPAFEAAARLVIRHRDRGSDSAGPIGHGANEFNAAQTSGDPIEGGTQLRRGDRLSKQVADDREALGVRRWIITSQGPQGVDLIHRMQGPLSGCCHPGIARCRSAVHALGAERVKPGSHGADGDSQSHRDLFVAQVDPCEKKEGVAIARGEVHQRLRDRGSRQRRIEPAVDPAEAVILVSLAIEARVKRR